MEPGSASAPLDLGLLLSAPSFDAIMISDGVGRPQDARVIAANDAALELWGYPRGELLGMRAFDLITPRTVQHLMVAKNRGETAEYEAECHRRDGAIFHISARSRLGTYQGQFARISIVKDVTRQKQQEAALRHSEAVLKRSQALVHLGSFENRFDPPQDFWSDETFRVMGFAVAPSPPSLEAILSHFDPQDAVRYRTMIATAREGAFGDTFKLVMADGTERWIETRGEVKKTPDGRLIGVLGTVQDVTERLAKERLLEASEQRFQLLVESLPDCVAIQQEGRWLYFNSAGLKLFGASNLDEIVGTPVLDRVPPEHRAAAAERAARVRQGQTTSPIAQTMLRLDGTSIEVEVVGMPGVFRGQPANQLLIRNLTERRAAEVALAASEERYRALSEASPEIIVVESHGRTVYINRAGLTFVGAQELVEVLDRSVLEFIGPRDRDRIAAAAQVIYAGGTVSPMAACALRADGSEAEVEISLSAFPFEGMDCVRAVIRDITPIRLAESLRNEVEVLRRTDAVKDEFLRIISHELRTPLNVITGFSYLLRTAALAVDDPKALSWLDEIDRATRSMLALIKDLLDYSAIQAGRMGVQPTWVDSWTLLAEIAQQFAPMYAAKEQTLAIVSGSLPPVWADAQRLKQVLSNLLSNASRYSPHQARVTITGRSQGAVLRLEIRDDGPGIVPEKVARLFKPFAVGGDSSQVGGIGLGLAISRGLMEAMHGTIDLESTPGVGSCFGLTLPCREPLGEASDGRPD